MIALSPADCALLPTRIQTKLSQSFNVHLLLKIDFYFELFSMVYKFTIHRGLSVAIRNKLSNLFVLITLSCSNLAGCPVMRLHQRIYLQQPCRAWSEMIQGVSFDIQGDWRLPIQIATVGLNEMRNLFLKSLEI